MKRLGVNIDHVATIRNARGEHHPSPFDAAIFVSKLGADSVTIHLREDRRHINDLDAKKNMFNKKVIYKLRNIYKLRYCENSFKNKTKLCMHCSRK